MSHAVVTIILPGDTANDAINDAISEAMAPYDENLQVPHHEKFDPIDLERMRAYYEEHKDELEFSKLNLKWIENLVPLVQDWNGGENAKAVIVEGVKTIEYDMMDNPNAKWDWWVIGGRWAGYFTTKEGREVDIIRVREIDWDKTDQHNGGTTAAFALLDSRLDPPDSWTENGQLGWFGASTPGTMSEDEWRATWRKTIQSLPPDTIVVAVDYHI